MTGFQPMGAPNMNGGQFGQAGQAQRNARLRAGRNTRDANHHFSHHNGGGGYSSTSASSESSPLEGEASPTPMDSQSTTSVSSSIQ